MNKLLAIDDAMRAMFAILITHIEDKESLELDAISGESYVGFSNGHSLVKVEKTEQCIKCNEYSDFLINFVALYHIRKEFLRA